MDTLLPADLIKNWLLWEGTRQGLETASLSAALNKGLSHGPWTSPEGQPSKQKGLREHTKLELNARLLRDYSTHWDESAMATRAAVLFDAAAAIWPSPTVMQDALVQPVASND